MFKWFFYLNAKSYAWFRTSVVYNINIENLIYRGQENQIIINKSKKITINFHHSNISLQGNLNDLADLLTVNGNKEEAKELVNAENQLEQAEQLKTPDEVKKKGLTNRLKRVIDELNDTNSKLHKTVSGIKNGISIAKDIGEGYNKIALWLGLP